MVDWSKKARENKGIILTVAFVVAVLIAFAVPGTNWPEAFRKFRDKRVDIAANALSGLVVAIIALTSWRIQQAWSQMITASHKKVDKEKARTILVTRLASEKEAFAKRIEGNGSAVAAKRVFDQFQSWLEENKLENWADNHDFIMEFQKPEPNLLFAFMLMQRHSVSEIGPENQAALAGAIRRVGIPKISDDLFPWPPS